MDLATGAMGSLLLKLGQLLTEEYKLQTGVKEDVKYLERELKSMYAALCKVGRVPRDQLDEQVKLWANEVRDLSFIMEDIIDKFLVRVEGSEPAIKPRKLKKLMKKMGDLFTKSKTRHAISNEIRNIKVRVAEAADRRDRYRVHDVVPATTSTFDPRLLSLYNDRKGIVGIDGAVNKLTEMLSGGDSDVSKQLKILSIFGFGGLGKTTVADAVYGNLRGQYDCSAFVPVGRDPSPKKLLMDILFRIDKQMCQNSNLSMWDESMLIDKLREFLEKKRYFIVIDDIWDMQIWKIVMCALVDNNCASKIITTTRILDVAQKAGEVYKLEPLSHDLSAELFQTRLFGGKNKCPHDLPAMAYGKILYKCGGVPLAIITMASLLINKPMEFWSKVYNSIGFGHEDNKDIENTRKILLFSYYDLPSHLRTCLLYMSIYPEDHFIKKNTLIWKWVTEGFVHEETGSGLYEIGERYFTELVNKGMILPVETPYQGIITGCRVHDMILDIICLLSKEENFVTILNNNEQYTSSHSYARRLAVGERVQILDTTCMPQVRSFIAMCFSDQLPLLSCFVVLRVLDLEGVMPRDDPIYLGHLGKLVHLRYLGLQNMGICVLPEELGYLKFLQVLDLSGNSHLNELPCSTGLLSKIKCLNIEGTGIRVSEYWIGNLTSLEELCLSCVEEEESNLFVGELGKLTELRKLCISGNLWLFSASSIRACAESLAKLQKIQVIDISKIVCRDSDDGISCLEGYVPPPQLRVLHMSCQQPGLLAEISSSLLPNLTHLSIDVESPDLKIFGLFPELLTLRLDMPDGLQHDVMGGAGAFPKLRLFETNAMLGQFTKGDMPSLQWLQFRVEVLENDDNFHFDFGSLGNLPLLQKVTPRVQCGPHVDINKVKETVKNAIKILPKRLILAFPYEEEEEIEILPKRHRSQGGSDQIFAVKYKTPLMLEYVKRREVRKRS